LATQVAVAIWHNGYQVWSQSCTDTVVLPNGRRIAVDDIRRIDREYEMEFRAELKKPENTDWIYGVDEYPREVYIGPPRKHVLQHEDMRDLAEYLDAKKLGTNGDMVDILIEESGVTLYVRRLREAAINAFLAAFLICVVKLLVVYMRDGEWSDHCNYIVVESLGNGFLTIVGAALTFAFKQVLRNALTVFGGGVALLHLVQGSPHTFYAIWSLFVAAVDLIAAVKENDEVHNFVRNIPAETLRYVREVSAETLRYLREVTTAVKQRIEAFRAAAARVICNWWQSIRTHADTNTFVLTGKVLVYAGARQAGKETINRGLGDVAGKFFSRFVGAPGLFSVAVHGAVDAFEVIRASPENRLNRAMRSLAGFTGMAVAGGGIVALGGGGLCLLVGSEVAYILGSACVRETVNQQEQMLMHNWWNQLLDGIQAIFIQHPVPQML